MDDVVVTQVFGRRKKTNWLGKDEDFYFAAGEMQFDVDFSETLGFETL